MAGGPRREKVPVGLALQDLGDQVRDRLALEGPAPGQALVEDAAERPDVGALVHHASPGLLGAHVGRGAQDHSGLGRRVAHGGRRGQVHVRTCALGRTGFGQTEVQHLGRAGRGEHHVPGLQVPVDDPVLVGRLHLRRDLPGDFDGILEREGAPGEPVGQGLALDQFQDQVTPPVDLLHPVDPGDVGVGERGQEPGLALEAGQPLGVPGELGGERLDGHVAPQPGVARAVDLPHAAGSEEGEDPIGTEPRAGGEVHRGILPQRHSPEWRGPPGAPREGPTGRADEKTGGFDAGSGATAGL